MNTLSGTITYRQRVALPSGAIVEVELQDVSRADAPAIVVASQKVTTKGEQAPIPFELKYDSAKIDPKHRYAAAARILIDGELRWKSPGGVPVLASGAPASGIEIVVGATEEPKADDKATITGNVTYRQRVALPPNAVVEVQFQDVSRSGAPAIVLGSQTIEAKGRQVPIPFEITYDPKKLEAGHTYSVFAKITVDGKLAWITKQAHRVVPKGPSTQVEVTLDQVS